MARRSLRLTGERDPATHVLADAVQLRVVVSELLRNTDFAAPDDSEVCVDVGTERCGARTMAVLTIRDAGPGLSPTDQRHLFDPFYSGRPAGRGLGFGLSKCWRIVTLHGGCLHVENVHPGLCVTVHWPTP